MFSVESNKKRMENNRDISGSNKTARSAHKHATLKRREEITELLAKGYNGHKISEIIGLKDTVVYRIISKINAKLHQKIERHFESYIQRINIGYNKVLSECWDAWERSKCDHKGEPRQPNVLYMDRILASMEAMRKLHGLDKIVPKSDDVSSNAKQSLDWDSLTARKLLSSVTVNINGNHAASSRSNDGSGSDISVVPHNLSGDKVQQIRDEVEERILELERRAEAKIARETQDSISSLQEYTKGKVTQPSPTIKKIKRVIPLKRTIVVQASNSPLGDE